MRIDSMLFEPPKSEQDISIPRVRQAGSAPQLLSYDAELPVPPVAETETENLVSPRQRSETVWLENERQVIRLVDERTGELVRQIPTDEVLRVSRNLDQMLVQEQQPASFDTEV